MSVFDSIRAGAAGAAALGLGAAVAAKNEQDAAAAAAAAADAADATEEAKVAEDDSSVNEDTAVTAAAPAADEDSVVMGSNPVRGAPETPKSIKTVPLSEEAKREQRAKLCIYGAFAALLLIVVAVGLGLGLSRRDDGSRGITTMAPTAAPEPGAPTAEPIVPAGPTAAPTSSPTVSAFDILLSYLASISPMAVLLSRTHRVLSIRLPSGSLPTPAFRATLRPKSISDMPWRPSIWLPTVTIGD